MRLFFSLILSFTYLSAWCQTTVMISGTVSDEQGDPVEEHLIVASSKADPSFFEIGFSDEQGQYTINYDEGLLDGCLNLTSFDCDGGLLFDEICWKSDSLTFIVDYDIDCSQVLPCRVGIVFRPIGLDKLELVAKSPQAAQPITYLWSTGEDTKSIIIDSAAFDEYCVSITDADGCQNWDCLFYGNHIECEAYFFFDENAHTLESISFGSGDLAYRWKKDDVWLKDTSSFLVVNRSGQYCLEIMDKEDCVSTYCEDIDIGNVNPYCHSFIKVSPSNGVYNAEASAFGIPPFDYEWSNGQIGKEIEFGPNEDISVLVRDSEGCVSIADYFGSEGTCSVVLNCKPVDEDISEVAAIPIGKAPFEYLWNTTSEDPIITIDQEGEYCVTITDADGCISSACEYITIKDPIRCDFDLVVIDDTDGVLTIDVPEQFGIDEFYGNFGELIEFPYKITDDPGFLCVFGIDVDGNCIHNTCLPINDGVCNGDAFIEIDTLVGDKYQMQAFVQGGSGDYLVRWSNGIENPVIIVEDDPFFLCAEIFDLGTNCRYFTCVDDTKNPLEDSKYVVGTLLDQYAGLPLNGMVDIYVKDFNEYYYYETVEAINGVYTCGIECYSDYLIKAVSIEPNEGILYVPSYAEKAIFHEEAQMIDCQSTSQIIHTPILGHRLIAVKGPGTIGGHVIDDFGMLDYFETDIILTTLDSTPIKHEQYVEGSKFNMFDIPYGNYYLFLTNVDLPTIRIEIEISPDDRHKEVVFNTTGISTNNKPEPNVLTSIYPNPTTGHLIVEGLEGDGQEYKIINQVGQLVQLGEIKAGRIDVVDLASGLYFLHIGDITNTYKFIKI